MKLKVTTKRADTNDRYYVEYLENLAYKLWKQIKNKYSLHCIKQDAPLNYSGERRIRDHILEKMIVTTTVKITMKELDVLFE